MSDEMTPTERRARLRAALFPHKTGQQLREHERERCLADAERSTKAESTANCTPTPEEIAEACEAFREGWSESRFGEEPEPLGVTEARFITGRRGQPGL